MKKTLILVAVITTTLLFTNKSFGKKNNQKIVKPHKTIQFVFCSDVHFGLVKPIFREKQNITSADVNAAMIAQINSLPLLKIPNDGGASAGKKINGIDAVIITGDLCNRQEKGVQSASASWKEFETDYVLKLNLLDKNGKKAKLLLTPGNHDISDAIGFEKPMVPLVDNASLVNIYNMMMQPKFLKNASNFNHTTDKINYSRDFGSVHFMFVDGWPDSTERIWMKKDLQQIKKNTPVLLFTHAMPDVEARFFTNPNGDHSINATDGFENLVTETFKDGKTIEDSAILEHRGLAAFLQAHKNIKAYLHGHSNYTEFYDWKVPEYQVDIPCFRVDSPMKGKYSARDETKLSFELITIDETTKTMTVRECLWNTQPNNPTQKIVWGISKTISLK